MARWIEICAFHDVPMDHPLGLVAEGVSLAIVRRGDELAALADRCPHQEFPLSRGCLRDGVLVCALHNWTFPVFEPDPDAVPPELRCERYPVRTRGGRVEVDLGARDARGR